MCIKTELIFPGEPEERTEMEELKTCPFCGAQAISESDIPAEGLYAICCENTACPVKPFVVGKTMQEATERWNTRKPMEQMSGKEAVSRLFR